MRVTKTAIDGVVIIEPRVFDDSRGYFFESYSKRVFDAEVTPVDFVQDNESMSTYGVMRGLHFQTPPFTQAKLVRCVRGRVLDVAVDIRKGSPTHGIAHGFAVLSDVAVFQYKCDNYYAPDHDGGISILDTSLGIDWIIDPCKATLSPKDMNHPLLRDFDSPFEYGMGICM